MPTIRPERCPTCKRKIKRSNDANRRYWALLHVMSEKINAHGGGYSADVWHWWAKSKFLGCDDIRLPNKKVLSIPKSTADLDTAEFNDYMTQVEAFANERGAYLEDSQHE